MPDTNKNQICQIADKLNISVYKQVISDDGNEFEYIKYNSRVPTQKRQQFLLPLNMKLCFQKKHKSEPGTDWCRVRICYFWWR